MINETQETTREEELIDKEFSIRKRNLVERVGEGVTEIAKGLGYTLIPSVTLTSWGLNIAKARGEVDSVSGDLVKLGVLYGGLSILFYGIPKVLEGIETLRYNNDGDSQITRVINDCARVARNSSTDNSKNNSYTEISKGIAKTVLTVGTTVLTAYLAHKGSQFAIPVAGINLAVLGKNLIGYHPINCFGGYIDKPYFSLFDNFRLGRAWSKISKLQKDNKLSSGNKEIMTKDCYLELGRNFIGGP